MSNISLFLALCVPRVIYVLLTDQEAGDTALYSKIATNILSGCGFSASTHPSFCEPIIGGYFPGYPFFLSVFYYFDFSNKTVAVVTAVLLVLSILYLRRAMEVFTGNVKIALLICVALGLSPLTIGFSRFILIEPVLTVFSIFILAQSLIYLKLKKQPDLLILLILISISVYFKPTSVVFIAPLLLIFIFVKRSNFIPPIVIAGVLLFAAVLPWELRNRNLGNESLLSGTSSIYPDIKGYHSWLKTWVITEYERAYALFPVWSGEPQNVKIQSNIFLSEAEVLEAKALIDTHLTVSLEWGTSIDDKFSLLAQSRQEGQSVPVVIGLRALQTAGVLLHPANSWGFPLSLSVGGSVNSVSLDFIFKVAGKAILFLYRLGIFLVLLCFVFYAIRYLWCDWYAPIKNREISLLGRTSFFDSQGIERKAKSQLTWENHDAVGSGFHLILLSFVLLVATIFLHVFVRFSLEHRYFVPVVPWIEMAVFYAILIRMKRFR